ncbi:MAG: type I-C CRISPR-associated protein Cas8c/Csd1 [Roseburia faecis]|jgi:CRISPR-associated protein Csd1
MLRALYDYAIKHELVLPPGFAYKTIKAYISLDKNGKFIGIVMGNDEPVLCPDIGSLANGKDKCNILVEKKQIVMGNADNIKKQFFYQVLKEGSTTIPEFGICEDLNYQKSETKNIIEEMERYKIKDADRVSFMVGGRRIVELSEVKKWWEDYRVRFQKTEGKEKARCLITGEKIVPMETVPPITGLAVVGGHARGDALICFDKPAYQSYGMKKSTNAPVAEEAIFAVKMALDRLLIDAPILANMKFVHWYEKPLEKDKDPFESDDFLGNDFLEEGTDTKFDDIFTNTKETEQNAKKQADDLVTSIVSGKKTVELKNYYTILLLSGVNGRVMVRYYEQGSYELLQKNIFLWEQQLELLDITGNQNVKPYKLNARLLRLLSKQRSEKNIFERVKKELSGVTQNIITAIIHGTPLPDVIAVRSLAYIRSQMLEISGENERQKIPDAIACQWLKVWLLRKDKESKIMSYYNPKHKSVAYHCGAAMAMHATIQNYAMAGVNANIVQRFYASGSRTPALVLAKLNELSEYHFQKIKSEWLKNELKIQLNEIYVAIGDVIPVTLTLEGQAYFALGYRQMCAELQHRRNERMKK